MKRSCIGKCWMGGLTAGVLASVAGCGVLPPVYPFIELDVETAVVDGELAATLTARASYSGLLAGFSRGSLAEFAVPTLLVNGETLIDPRDPWFAGDNPYAVQVFEVEREWPIADRQTYELKLSYADGTSFDRSFVAPPLLTLTSHEPGAEIRRSDFVLTWGALDGGEAELREIDVTIQGELGGSFTERFDPSESGQNIELNMDELAEVVSGPITIELVAIEYCCSSLDEDPYVPSRYVTTTSTFQLTLADE